MSRIALPYHTPAADRVIASSWNLVIRSVDVGDLPAEVPEWDYNTDLKISRTVKIDFDAIYSDSRIPPSAELAATVVWESSGSRQRRRAYRCKIEDQNELNVECVLAGSEVGGTVTITTFICLGTAIESAAQPFTAHLGGSILWSDSTEVRLEDDAPQFPVTIVDFALTNLPEKSAWYLQISNNLDSAALGSLLLCINLANPTVSSAFEHAAAPALEGVNIVQAVHADVARQMVEHALVDEEFNHDIEYPDESLGRMLQSLIQRYFPDQDVDEIRARRNALPTLFSAEVQDAVGILGGVK